MVEAWASRLEAGDGQAAWNLFVDRYRKLILASIKRLVRDPDDVMDVFATVCQALSAGNFARLRRYSDQSPQGATVATWLVTVVRNLTIDWIRQQEGRRRPSVPAILSPAQQEIYAAICIAGCSHVEAYETIRTRTGSPLSFGQFLREVRAVHRVAPCPASAPLRRPAGAFRNTSSDPSSIADLTAQAVAPADPAETAESAERIGAALASQPADVRLAVELFVVDRMSAAAVASVVGWPNAKAVYNRVYRALSLLRAELARQGVGPRDL